jgi:hypothetical protein
VIRQEESERKAKQYFKDLGFTIKQYDLEGRRKGADFFIELEDCIQSVEVKTEDYFGFKNFPAPQLKRVLNGGIVAIVEDDQIHLKTKEDILNYEIASYRVTWKK